MHIDYELSERDFVHGWLKVYQPPIPFLFSASSLAGLAFFAISVLQAARQSLVQGIPWLFGGVVLGLPAIFLFWHAQRNKRGAQQVYQSSPAAQARVSVDLSEEGMEFSGMDFRLKTNWSQVWSFSEDRRAFIVRHRSQPPTTRPLTWHVVPKHDLSADEINRFREYLQRKMPAKARNRK